VRSVGRLVKAASIRARWLISALPAIGAKAALAMVSPAAFRKVLRERLFDLRDITFISPPPEVFM